MEQKRKDVAEKRSQWKRDQVHLDPSRLVFIDETWAKTNMTRTFGRSTRGTRLIERVPAGRWETTTFLGALRVVGFTAPLTIDGPINGVIFLAWVEQHLAPTLSAGDVVIMDNLSSHKVAVIVWQVTIADRDLHVNSGVFATPRSCSANMTYLETKNSQPRRVELRRFCRCKN